MNAYTVIPARGGSKSIPKKNIKPLGGKPLIQYSIEYSNRSTRVTRTVVSTDAEDIAGIALGCGADVPFLRPAELAQDDTQDYPVFRHALETLESTYHETIDVLILLRPTSPLRPPGLIEQALDLLDRFPAATSVRAVTSSHEHPYRQWIENGVFIQGYEKEIHEPYNLPRQQLPRAYFQTGDLEAIRRQTLLDGSVSGDRVLPLLIPREQMIDIDHWDDFLKAENKMQSREDHGH